MKELNAKERKTYPLATGVLDYFPDALMEVAHVSYVGNEQHNPGEAVHWDRDKSKDEADALLRHFKDRGKFDSDGLRHSAKMAWRALAFLQKELEAENDSSLQESYEKYKAALEILGSSASKTIKTTAEYTTPVYTYTSPLQSEWSTYNAKWTQEQLYDYEVAPVKSRFDTCVKGTDDQGDGFKE